MEAPQINLSPTKERTKLSKRIVAIRKTKIIRTLEPKIKSPQMITRIVFYFDFTKTNQLNKSIKHPFNST